MSLVKKPTMTKEKLAAVRANGKLSRGPRTRKGREHSRTANLRHGHYSEAQQAALRAMGEDPAEFEELLDAVRKEFVPTGRLQEALAERLARALLLMERADRSREGAVLARAQSLEAGRDNRLHARMMRLRMTAESLASLARSVARENYVTLPSDLELMKSLAQDPEVNEMGEIALALFCQLQDPGAKDEFGRPVSSYEQQQAVLIRVKEIFGLNDPPPYQIKVASDLNQEQGAEPGPHNPDSFAVAPPVPAVPKPNPYRHITARQWEAREPVRQLLENILTHQAELCEGLRRAILKDSLRGPSPFERAAECAPISRDSLIARRLQESNLREVRRLTNLLLKMKSVKRRTRAARSTH